MITTEQKFLLRPSTILNRVEEQYLKFIGDNCGASDSDLLNGFKNLVNSSPKHTVHAKILHHEEKAIILETSKYVQGTGTFMDHQVWIFTKASENTYSWTLKRYTI